MAGINLHYRWTLYLIVCLACLVRVFVLINYVEVPGDGPARAFLTYMWYESPSLDMHGGWLPGFRPITGLFSYVLSNPLYSTRVFNVLVGTATVLVFFWLTREIYDQYTAFVSALALAVFPQHVALSATSLTEPLFIFLVLLSMTLVIWSVNKNRFGRICFIVSLLSFVAATTVRYESWTLIPILPFYYFLRTRRLKTSFVLSFALAAFPLIWSLSNYLHHGDPLIGFRRATEAAPQFEKIREYIGQYPISLWSAGGFLIHKISVHGGLFVAILAGIGLVDTGIRLFKRRATIEELLLGSTAVIFYIVMLRLMMDKGYAILDRYLMFGTIILLPAGIYAGRSVVSKVESYRWLFPAAFIGSVLLVNYMNSYQRYVTPEVPIDSQNVASWLQQNRPNDVAVLMTRMDWHSTYIPLYDRSLAGNFDIISSSRLAFGEDTLVDFMCRRQPRLLISMPKDEEFIAWVEGVAGTSIESAMIIVEIGQFQIYDIVDIHFSCMK